MQGTRANVNGDNNDEAFRRAFDKNMAAISNNTPGTKVTYWAIMARQFAPGKACMTAEPVVFQCTDTGSWTTQFPRQSTYAALGMIEPANSMLRTLKMLDCSQPLPGTNVRVYETYEACVASTGAEAR